MKRMTFKRISILGLVLLAASAATAFIAKDQKDQNGHLTGNAMYTSTPNTCRALIGTELRDCNDTQKAAGSSSAGGTAPTGAAATSDGFGANTTFD